VKTKRQLNLNVPAGFRQSSNLQKNFYSFTPPRWSSLLVEDNIEPILPIVQDNSTPSANETSSPITNQSTMVNVPIIHCVDKPSSSLPSRLTLTEDLIRANVGF